MYSAARKSGYWDTHTGRGRIRVRARSANSQAVSIFGHHSVDHGSRVVVSRVRGAIRSRDLRDEVREIGRNN